MAVFPPIQSHYSVKKSAAVLGMGSDNVVMVKCDERWVHSQSTQVFVNIQCDLRQKKCLLTCECLCYGKM